MFRPRPHVSGYFRIRNFFFPDSATVHRYPANRQRIRKKINPLSRVEKNKRDESDNVWTRPEKYIRNEYYNVWMGESGYFSDPMT